MREFFRNFWLTMYYYLNRKKVHEILAERSKQILKSDELVIERRGPAEEKKDCLITIGWATICCTPKITRAHCNALAQTNPDYVGQWLDNACLNTTAKPCSEVQS